MYFKFNIYIKSIYLVNIFHLQKKKMHGLNCCEFCECLACAGLLGLCCSAAANKGAGGYNQYHRPQQAHYVSPVPVMNQQQYYHARPVSNHHYHNRHKYYRRSSS